MGLEALAPFLLVEDDENDIILIQRVFKEAGLNHPLHVVRNGSEAIAYLSGTSPFADRAKNPLPSFMFLDLKMPGLNGFDVLAWLRTQPSLRTIRVIILTSSNNVFDVNQAYKLGANSYLTKTPDFDRFVANTVAFASYWLGLDHLGDLASSPIAPATIAPTLLPQAPEPSKSGTE